MDRNATRYPLAQSLQEMVKGKVFDGLQSVGQKFPCTVTKVFSSGIVEVNFEVNSGIKTIPKMTVPIGYPQYIRFPIQVGARGFCVAADTRLGNMTNLGTGTPDLSTPGNLQGLVFLFLGNTTWQDPVDPNALELYGPDGVNLYDTNHTTLFKLNSDGTVKITAPTSVTITSPSTSVSGDATVGGNLAVDGSIGIDGDLNVGGTTTSSAGGGGHTVSGQSPAQDISKTVVAITTAPCLGYKYTSGGLSRVDLASGADTTKPANCLITQNAPINTDVTVFLPGSWLQGLTGLDRGGQYWLDYATPGGMIPAAPPMGFGYGTQTVGWADNLGEQLYFFPSPIQGS